MGLGWMGISIMFCLWREITRLPALCQLSARLTRAVAKTSPRSVPAQRHRPKRRPLLSLPPHMLLSSSSLHHQSPSPTNNSLYQQLPKQTPSTPQTNPINSPNKPHQLFTMATLSCKSPLLPMPCASDDSELLVCCHLPQQQHKPSSPSLWHPSSKHH